MHLFGRKQDQYNRPGNRGKATDMTEGATEEPGDEAERDHFLRQLEEERRQRLEDVQKERAERLDAQEEQRRLNKENRRLTQEASDLRLRLEQERERARRRGFFETLFGSERSEEPSDDR